MDKELTLAFGGVVSNSCTPQGSTQAQLLVLLSEAAAALKSAVALL